MDAGYVNGPIQSGEATAAGDLRHDYGTQ